MIARYAIPFFFIMGLVVAPLVFILLCRWLAPRKIWRQAALACTLLIWAAVAYGYFVGFESLEVRQFEYVSEDLPEAFDGYRIGLDVNDVVRTGAERHHLCHAGL